MTNFYILIGLAATLGAACLIIARSDDWKDMLSSGLAVSAFVSFVASLVALIVQHRP